MNRKSLASVTILAMLFLLLVRVQSAKSVSMVIVVPDDYLQIQEAIEAANEGDTIRVKNGYYVENPVINKSVSLVGEDRDTTVIDVIAGLKIEADNVIVTGLTVFDGYEGISVGANYCNISGNKIVDSDSGVVLHGGENNIVAGNIFESIGPAGAVVLWFSDNNLVNNNYISSCTEGIQLREGSSFNMVKENIITNCKNVAVRLLGAYSPPMWYYPSNNTILRNSISDSGIGATIYASNNNIISDNNFVNNTYQFSANEEYFIIWGGSVSVNIIEGNFWSDYNGTDSNGDGMGDVPYVLDENNMDPYPLMKPVSIPTSPESTSSPEPTITTSPSPFPSEEPQLGQDVLLGVAVTVAVLAVGLGLLVYLIKRK
jgi:nitrous oxidase accessory protein